MRIGTSARRPAALVTVVAASLALGACSAGDIGGGGDSGGGATTLSYLVDNATTTVAAANSVAQAFHAANPTITVKVETRPGGADGDNLVKTRLSTGDMSDVFYYNNGSLLQALKPAQNLTPLSDQSWVSDLDQTFADATSADGKLYGAPSATGFGGGILYNIPIYKKLGLEVPKTWAEFMKNADAIKKAGIAPVIQTYQTDTWTSQLLVLADYHNVEATVPDFAAQYTAGKDKYATTPAALAGFQHIQQLHDGGYFNKDYRSANYNAGLKALATGTGAMYPQLGAGRTAFEAVAPGKANDIGIFALPGTDAATNGLTFWPGNAIYIPKTTTGAKLEAAKKFVAFFTTKAGCDALIKGSDPSGPFLVKSCALPADVSQVAKDTQAYAKAGEVSPALEFKSPIKGPNLEQICIQVGTGQVSAEKGAALYDKDVRKQALQLGLPGWS